MHGLKTSSRRWAPLVLSLLLAACGGGGGGGGNEAPPAPPDPIVAGAPGYGTGALPAGARMVPLAEFKAWAGSDPVSFMTRQALDAAAQAETQRIAGLKTEVEAAAAANPDIAAQLQLSTQSTQRLSIDADGTRRVSVGGQTYTLDGIDSVHAALGASLRQTNARANIESLYRTLIDTVPADQRAGLPAADALAALSDADLRAARDDLTRRALDFSPDRGEPGTPAARAAASPAGRTRLLASGTNTETLCVPVQGGLRSRVNWTLKHAITPVKQQGRRGTCTAHGVVAGMDTWVRHFSDVKLSLSEQALYAEAKGVWFPKPNDYGDGLGALDALGALKSTGYRVSDESYWPYNPSSERIKNDATQTYTHSCDGYAGPCSDTVHQRPRLCTQVNGTTYCAYKLPAGMTTPSAANARVTNWVSLWDPQQAASSLASLKAMLASGRPVVLGMAVDDDFMDASNAGMSSGLVQGYRNADPAGKHTVVALGYVPNSAMPAGMESDGDGYIVVKNSWGCSGDEGHWYLSTSWIKRRVYEAVAVTGVTQTVQASAAPTASMSAKRGRATNGDELSFVVNSDQPIRRLELMWLGSSEPLMAWTAPGSQGQSGPLTLTPYAGADLGRFSDGLNHFRARVYDEAGNAVLSSWVSVVVDKLPPVVALSANATTVLAGNSVTFTAEATDASGIQKVELYRGFQRVATMVPFPDPAGPTYRATYTFATGDLGPAVFLAMATDLAGRARIAPPVTVTAVTVLPPIVSSFSATPNDLQAPGGSVTLSWQSLGASSVSIDNGVGVQPASGSVTVNVATSTTFTLTATNSKGSTTAQTLVVVHPVIAPQIQSFSATPASLPFGGGSTTLAWNFFGSSPATSVAISPDVGDVTGLTSKVVNVAATTTYTLTASNAGGTRTRTLTVEVAGDTTPPTVTLAASSGNVTSAGDLKLTASASDNVGVTRVDFYRGSALLGSATAAPFAWSVPLTAADNGSPSFTAKAYDAAGNSTTSDAVTVTVAIPVPDTTPPTVALSSSSASVVAPATVTLTASATDNVGVSSVVFFEGATLLATRTAAPYTLDIAYTSAAAGTHVYTARAYDAAGNSTDSATLNVQVSLPAPTDRFVDPVAGLDGNDGLSLATAYKTITKAASTVSTGGTIWLAAGVYPPENAGTPDVSYLAAIPAGRTVRTLVDGTATLRFGLSFAAGGAVRGIVFDSGSVMGDQTAVQATSGTVTVTAVRFTNLGCVTCGGGGFGAKAALRVLGNAQVVLDAGAGNPVLFDTGVGNAVLAYESAVVTINGGTLNSGGTCNGDECTAQMKVAGTAQLTLNDMLLPLKPPPTSVLSPQPLVLAQAGAVVKVNRATITQAATPANPRDFAIVNGTASFTLTDSTVSGNFHNLVGLQNGTPTIAFNGVTATSRHTGQAAVGRTVFFVDAVPTVTLLNSSFSLNLASGIGSTAVLSLDNGGEATVTGNTFSGNLNALYFGGSKTYAVKLQNNVFSGNATCTRPSCFTVWLEGSATSSFDLGSAVRPGGNSFVAASAGTGVVVNTNAAVTVSAVGNTWAPGVQGADASGLYKFGTAPCSANSCIVSTGSGQNFVWQSGAIKLSGP